MNKLFCLLFVAIKLFSDGEIVVRLSQETPLASVYLGKINPKQSRFNSDYCKALQDILANDLDMCGRIERTAFSEELEKVLMLGDPKECFGDQKWDKSKAQYVVKPIVEASGIAAFVFTIKTRSLLKIKHLQLTGNLTEDRKLVHQLSDGIHKLLFSKEGIARTHILYSVQTGCTKKWKSEIWECDWDGDNARQLTEENNYAITPAYFPAKKGFNVNKYLYVSYRNGVPKIFLALAGEKIGKPLVTLRGNQLLPTVCRDRSKLAFICDAGGRADLFVQKIDVERGLMSRPIQAYSFPSSVQASPTFSPDGKKVAFVSDKEGTPRIYIIDTPTSFRGNKLPEAICLTTKNRENTCPNWSPDGRKIAYSAKTDGTRQIWIYDFDRGEETQLTQGAGHKENPSFAPNSLHLVYNLCDDESSELYVVNLNQKVAKKITSGAGKKLYPAWEP